MEIFCFLKVFTHKDLDLYKINLSDVIKGIVHQFLIGVIFFELLIEETFFIKNPFGKNNSDYK